MPFNPYHRRRDPDPFDEPTDRFVNRIMTFIVIIGLVLTGFAAALIFAIIQWISRQS